MGMFDNISISDSLPFTQEMKDLGIDSNDRSWQTKDLECYMGEYVIQGGKLFEQKYKIENWIQGNKSSKNFVDRIGYLDRKEPYLSQVHYHGEVFFYNFIQDVQGKWDCWVEFKAIFTNGIVERYELVKFEKEENTERKQRDKEFYNNLQRERNLWYNKYFFHTKPYRWFTFRIWRPGCNALGNFFYSIAHKL